MLPLIGCPPKLLSIVRSFYDDIMSTVQFDGDVSAEFGIKSGVKQGCILTPNLFGIFFALLLRHAFKRSTDGVYLHSRSDSFLFNISRLRAKTKTRTVTIRDLLYADDVAIVSDQQDGLQRLMDKFSDACDLFSLTISQKKTQVMGQASPAPPCITVSGKELEVAHQFQYLGSTTTDTLSLDVELSKCTGKALTTLSKLTKRVWENKHLTIPTKINVYKACVISTLLYGTESWTTYFTQEQKLQVFHLRCLHRILGIMWQDKVQNNNVLLRAGVPSMFTLLCQHCLCWLGHVHRMEDGCIPKDLLYGELATGARCRGHPDYVTRMYVSVTWKHATLTVSHGKPLQMTEPCGSNKCYKDWKEGRLPSKKKWWKMDQENSQSSAGPPRPTSSICLHMSGLQQRLQIQDWPLQPHKMMLISNLSGCYSIVNQLTDGCQMSKVDP